MLRLGAPIDEESYHNLDSTNQEPALEAVNDNGRTNSPSNVRLTVMTFTPGRIHVAILLAKAHVQNRSWYPTEGRHR